MAKEYVPIYFDWLEVTQDLTPEEKGNLIDAVVSYACGLEYEHLLAGGCKICFRFFKGQVDRNAAISDARAKAGSNKKQTETNGNKTEQSETNGNNAEQSATSLSKEKKKEKEKEKNKDIENAFARFWAAYPRKVNKPGAYKAFIKLDPDETLLQAMLAAIAKQKVSAQWQENGGQFIPHPATWLNGRRWEDDVAPASKKANQAADFEQRDYSGVNGELMDSLAAEMEQFKKGAI